VSRAYLDHASTSPLRPVALEAMLPYLREHHADPGRLHAEAHVTRVAVEDAREQVAARFGARPREVVFTASGTEAVNTATFGALARAGGGHVVTTAVEHSSVLDAVARGTDDVTIVGVDRQGRFDAQEIADATRPDTALVSIQLANHEVGTLQPAADVVSLVRGRSDAVVHVDACAAAGHVLVDFRELAADLCSVTGHTFGGPKGAAALLVRRGLRFPPFVVGGAQERARRAGIENVPAIVGFGAACAAITGPELDREARREHALTERLSSGALRRVDGVERYGDPEACLPHLVCLGVEGVEAEPILLALDQRGVAVHSGSSCSSESLEPSPVLAAMGVDADRSLRASVGWSSTDADVDAFLDAFPVVVGLLRDLRS
jgi:cysteine desulfurase